MPPRPLASNPLHVVQPVRRRAHTLANRFAQVPLPGLKNTIRGDPLTYFLINMRLKKIPGTNMWIGTGVYLDNIDAYPAGLSHSHLFLSSSHRKMPNDQKIAF